MNSLPEQLKKALQQKKDNNLIWKGPKVIKNNKVTQEVINIKEATEEQLHSFIAHCDNMLFNTDDKNPGRIYLLNLIDEQRNKCNTELFLRYLEGSYMPSDRATLSRFKYLQEIQECQKVNNEELLNKEVNFGELPVSTITQNIPEDFQSIPVKYVMQGCLDTLGIFQRKALTYNFISKIGLWLTNQEKKEFEEQNIKTTKDLLDYITEIHSLNKYIRPRITPTGLSYREFRALVTSFNRKYSDLTTDQLLVLRNKVLYRLQKELFEQADQWQCRKNIINKELKLRGQK